MTDVTAYWAPGIFRELDHLVRPDADTMDFDGTRYYLAVCGSVTYRPGTPSPGHRDQCDDCQARVYAATSCDSASAR
jgi:hypothetical protein